MMFLSSSCDILLLLMTLMGFSSYHRAEGMAQEDGMSVQKSLVSATLRCLERFVRRTKNKKQIRGYMSAQAPSSRAPVVSLQVLQSTPDLWHRTLTSARVVVALPTTMTSRLGGWGVCGGGVAHVSWERVWDSISSMKDMQSDMA